MYSSSSDTNLSTLSGRCFTRSWSWSTAGRSFRYSSSIDFFISLTKGDPRGWLTTTLPPGFKRDADTLRGSCRSVKVLITELKKMTSTPFCMLGNDPFESSRKSARRVLTSGNLSSTMSTISSHRSTAYTLSTFVDSSSQMYLSRVPGPLPTSKMTSSFLISAVLTISFSRGTTTEVHQFIGTSRDTSTLLSLEAKSFAASL
mmetsp:Transcript_15420/g.51755  ORF Transcript_15420/g.51755 Transcript_15420/m.51755 type:complete len:202 (-) Transcript_15420:282-887(-)